MGLFIEIQKLENEINEIPGAKNLEKLKELEYSIQLFEHNYEVLKGFLDQIISKKEIHSNLFYRPDQWKTALLFKEISFLLHNFVASVLSLVEHSRKIYRKLFEGKGQFQFYQQKVSLDLEQNDLVQFVQKLRQMCQHYSLPEVSAEWQTKSGKLTLYLHKNNLLQFDSWNKQAKNFITRSNGRINLIEVIKSYYEQITHFNNWAEKEITKLYSEEINAIQEINKKINQKKRIIVLEELEEAIKVEEGKRLQRLRFAISGALPFEEMQKILQYESDVKNWILKSLNILTKYIEIPIDLLEKIKSECK